MIWMVLAGFAAIALLPLALSLRRQTAARGRREAALALHRAQLEDLERDLAEGRILGPEHATAVLEVQRRLLAAGRESETDSGTGSRLPLLAALVVVPVAAFLLYSIGGHPGLPGVPLAARLSAEQEEDALISTLRQRLSLADPKDERTRQGYLLLGSAEETRGHWQAAAIAFRAALAVKFDATLAARTAEAVSRAQGRVTDDAAALFKRALDAAPADAPWRALAEQRIKEAAPDNGG